jgi:hypothetical protein
LTLLPSAGSPFKPLPKKTSFRVAVRRCTRVGTRSGVLVEDLGIVPDEIHHMTKDDVLNGNVDLINKAGGILAAMPVQSLKAEVQDGSVTTRIGVTTKNITRLDIFVDTRPDRSLDVKDGKTSFDLSPMTIRPKWLEIRGFRQGNLVASTRVSV